MADYDFTTRHNLSKLLGTSAVADVDEGIATLADELDAIIAAFDQGPFASRLVSTPGTPGITGRWYWATDTEALYYDMGTAWVEVWSTARAAALGANEDGVVRRGYKAVAAEETRTNTALGYMPDSDLIQNLDYPAGGIIRIRYVAEWKTLTGNKATAAAVVLDGVPTNQVSVTYVSSSYAPLRTDPLLGLFASTAAVPTPLAGAKDVAVEFAIAPATAGVYDVGIQFASESGSAGVRVKNRRLWVAVEGY